ncbi:MAG: DUF1573 domain-containing protein [Candidatus Bipolaricaulota bacterium]
MKALVCCALAVLWGGSIAALGAPVLEALPLSAEASVEAGSVVTKTFTLRNTGDETLTITRVLASCGCTATTLEKNELAPGETVDLTARVDTTGFSGTVVKTVSVQSNDPVQPSLVLRMTLRIQPSPEAPVSASEDETPSALAAASPTAAEPGTTPARASSEVADAPSSPVSPSAEETPEETAEPSAWAQPALGAAAIVAALAGAFVARAALRRRAKS